MFALHILVFIYLFTKLKYFFISFWSVDKAFDHLQAYYSNFAFLLHINCYNDYFNNSEYIYCIFLSQLTIFQLGQVLA